MIKTTNFFFLENIPFVSKIQAIFNALFVYFFVLKGNLCGLKYQNMDEKFNFYNNVTKNKFHNC
jgi:hypothetical protein